VDFSFNEEQEAIRDLATTILTDQVTPERLRELEQTDDRFDRKVWDEFAKAGLLAVSLPESVGGNGYGLLETALILEQIGKTVAMLPLLPTIVLGALPIAKFGSAEQQQAILPGVASGDTILTAALVEPGAEPDDPQTTATQTGNGEWRLDGAKICVPAGMLAHRILVPARAGADVAVFIIDPASDGVTRIAEETNNRLLEAHLELSGAPGELLATGAHVVEWMVLHATAALCTTQIGVCETALRLTAEYTKTREQFDRPIATFQAVGQRTADAYIDTESVRLTAWSAVWRLSEGMPAEAEVAIAKFFAADAGARVVHAAQHLHGGMGVDRDYPLHRYFLWAKQNELQLGGTTPQLLKLGKILAAQ
jgi:alkylation response protein AidB-like acyl-CoA dehydrogenase